MNIDLRHGDCIEILKTLPDNSVDSVITDPPYGLGFMNKEWDSPEKLRALTQREEQRSAQRKAEGKSPTTASFSKSVPPGLAIKGAKEGRWFQEWCELWAIELLRVLKPGGHLISFCAPRTYHRMATAFEDAGFEIRDQIMWVFGSGFPKSLNIGKAIDKIEGNEREVVDKVFPDGSKPRKTAGIFQGQFTNEKHFTKGNSEWEGWGTALKPAHEPMVLARKPLSEKSIAENVLKHGTGGLNIDASRIEIKEGDGTSAGHRTCNIFETEKISGGNGSPDYETHELGRFPANIIFDEEAGKLLDEQSGILKSGKMKGKYKNTIYQFQPGIRNGKEIELETYGDSGGASRFFYCPKASKKDRNEGLDDFEDKKSRKWRDDKGMKYTGSGNLRNEVSKNHHPTVKPTDLMRYLINLITPPNGVVLDPFMGSGSTGKAAVRCGVNFIGIEKEQEYMDIARARINYEKTKLDARK